MIYAARLRSDKRCCEPATLRKVRYLNSGLLALAGSADQFW